MKPFPIIRPLTTELRLSGTAVGSFAAVQGTIGTFLIQESARRYHLRFQRLVGFSANLTEIWRKPRADHSLKGGVAPLAQDLDLQIAAASGTSGVVGGGAGSNRAGVDIVQVVLHHWQTAWGKWEALGHQLMTLDHQEEVAAQLAWLLGTAGLERLGPVEPVGRATGLRRFRPRLQMSTSDMEGRVDQKFDASKTQIPEADAVGMAEQPCSFMVGGVGPLVDSPDPQGHRHLLAVVTEGSTGRGLMHQPNLAPLPLSGL